MQSTIQTTLSTIGTSVRDHTNTKSTVSTHTINNKNTISSIKLNMEYNLHYRMSQPMTMSSYTRPFTKEEIELSNKMASLFINLEDVV